MEQRVIRLAAWLVGASAPALATAQLATERVMLEPIAVTAEKRDAESGEVPASLAVEQGEALWLRDVKRREAAMAEVPNVQTGAVTARLYTSFASIRGVGSALIESDPAVGLYLDGTGVGSTQAYSGTLLDVDRIEILRGPQGTLYGRNNLAGSVNIISNRPDPAYLGGELGLDYGKYGSGGVNGVLNVPFSAEGEGSWAARVALSAARKHSDLTSSVDGSELNDGRDWHGRLSVGGKINSKLDFLGIVEAERHTLNGEMFGMPEADFLAHDTAIAIDDPSRIASRMATSSAQFTYHLGNGDRIVSHSSYQRSAVDVSGNGFPAGYFAAYDALFQMYGFPDFRYRSSNPYDGVYRQWAQEVRYVSDGNASFDWVTGLYAEHAEATREYGVGSSFSGGEATLRSKGRTRMNSYSVFADGTYALNPAWSLFGGLRVGRDKKDFDYDFEANAAAAMLGLASTFAPGYASSLSKTYITPRLGVQLVAGQTQWYASISTGYKSGGFNAGFVGLGDEGAYKSERLISYELGFKSMLLDSSLGVDGSLFYIDWRDQQVQGYNALTGATPLTNAQRSRSMGGELAARMRLGQGWSLRAGAGYADATYKDYTDARALDGSGSVDVSGNRQQYVSRFTGVLGADYEWQFGSFDLVGRVGANYQMRSAFYFDVQNTIRQPGYGLLNAYIGVENKRYALFLHAHNIGDKRYRTLATNLGSGLLVNAGEPQTIGATLRVRF